VPPVAPRTTPDPTGTTAAPPGSTSAQPLTDPLVFRVFNEIGIIDQLAGSRFERVMPKGLSMAQFRVLNHFVRLPGERSLAALARAFQVSRPAMGKVVHKLEQQALVAVRDNPDDSRGKLVSLTEAGARTRQAALAALAPEVVRLNEALGTQAFEALLPGLVRLRQWLDTNR
jgi:DNA-binding MarR family transcriptional regulator